MTRAYLAFTDRGEALAAGLAKALPGTVSRCGGKVSLSEWTAEHFKTCDALIFVGAVGIAVRAVAPHCRSKTTDPAVVAVDECGHFAVPLLSGHLGGANELARAIAAVCGAVAVITTATDANGLFAVDDWARQLGCKVLEVERIRTVSSALLAGRAVSFASDWPIAGRMPRGLVPAENADRADFALTMMPRGEGLHLVPPVGVLGIGCKKGTSADRLEAAFAAFCQENGLAPQAVGAAASIDLKQNETGLVEFCRRHGWALSFYSADQLRAVEGSFNPSAFVQSVTGVDNVCERAAVLAAGGSLVISKRAGGGVTMALAVRPFAPAWPNLAERRQADAE